MATAYGVRSVFQCAQLCLSHCKDIRVLLSYQRKHFATGDSCSVISSQESIKESSPRRKDTSRTTCSSNASTQPAISLLEISQGIPLWAESGNYAQSLNWHIYKNLITGESHCMGRSYLYEQTRTVWVRSNCYWTTSCPRGDCLTLHGLPFPFSALNLLQTSIYSCQNLRTCHCEHASYRP